MILSLRKNLKSRPSFCNECTFRFTMLLKSQFTGGQFGIEAGFSTSGWIIVNQSNKSRLRRVYMYGDPGPGITGVDPPGCEVKSPPGTEGLHKTIQPDLVPACAQNNERQWRTPNRSKPEAGR